MKTRNGFISNSSSCSFIIRMDGLEGKQLTIEDTKRFFPPSDRAREVLTINELEDIYITLWRLVTASKDDSDYYGFEDQSYPDFKWKKGRGVRCGQDSDSDRYSLMGDRTSQNLFYYNSSLFNTGNIRFAQEF